MLTVQKGLWLNPAKIGM